MTLLKSLFYKMGNGNSKTRNKDNRGGKTQTQQHEMHEVDSSNFSTELGAAYDPELVRMRRCLEKDQEAFILNNLMLSVQFFENYEQEILDIRAHPISGQEYDLNTILSQSQKHILLPDVLQEQVARHVKFTSTRRTGKLTVEPLQPVRMFVVLDNIEVNEVPEVSNYNSIPTEAPFYHMCLEPSSNQGFVKLRSLEVTPAKKEKTENDSDSDLSSIYEDDDELYNKDEQMFNPRVNPGARLLSQVEKRANSLGVKPPFTQSMSDLRNSDRINGETTFRMGKMHSQTNLILPQPPDENDELAERRLSGRVKPVSSAVLRGQLGSHSKLQQIKSKHQQAHQNGRSTSDVNSSSSGSEYRSGSSRANYVIDSDSDYGYATITNFNTPKPLVRPANIPASSSEIPASCFKKIVYTREGNVYSEKSEKLQQQTRQQRRIRMALQRQNKDRLYLKSDEFMYYFQDLFANRLAEPLSFEEDDVNEASRQGAVIYCDTMQLLEHNRALIIPHEIVPSIRVKWPECGNEWLKRWRAKVLDTGDNVIYMWPTKRMIDKVKKFGCHIIPEGYMPKRQTNPDHDVEWQLTFPAAERYLETCLSHPQARVYLMALMLHKTFIRAADTTFGLTTSHIRSQLFWLLEHNYSPSVWPENRTGESLRKLLRILYGAVSQSQLQDYFVSSKNLFTNIPRKYLLHTQKQLNRMLHNPVLYVIESMRNIWYKPEFFPVLDYKRLFKLLTMESKKLVPFLNPALSTIDRPVQVDTDEMVKFEEEFDRIGGFWDKAKTKEDPSRDRVQRGVQYQNIVNNKSKYAERESVIDIPYTCADLRGLRLSAFLDMFISHFIKMAERCYQYGAMKQKDLYFNQAERLSMILYDQTNGKDDAKNYLDMIKRLKNELERPKAQVDAPEIPKRNSQPVISIPLNQHFTNGSDEPGVSPILPPLGETKEYDTFNTSTERRPTVGFQDQTMEFENDGTIVIAEVNDVTLRNGDKKLPRIVSLSEGPERDSFLTDSTHV